MTFEKFLEATTYKQLHKLSGIYLLLDEEEKNKSLFHLIKSLLSAHKLGNAFSVFVYALERYFLLHPNKCNSRTMSLAASVIKRIAREHMANLEGESKYLQGDGPVVCTLEPNKVTWGETGLKGEDTCFYLNEKSVLMEHTSQTFNALTLPDADHCMINSSTAHCNIRANSHMPSVIHSGGGNIITSGWQSFVALLGGKGAKVQAEGYGNNVFSTGKHAHITMSDVCSGDIFASGANTTINLTACVIQKQHSTICSIGSNSTVILVRETNACFVRGKGSRVFLNRHTNKLLLGEGVRLFAFCYAGEKRQEAPVVLEGGKDLEADKVYEWDEETKWYKGLPFPLPYPLPNSSQSK